MVITANPTQIKLLPGRTAKPSEIKTNKAGLTRLLLKLSIIFNLDRVDIGFFLGSPFLVLTLAANHGISCQSPLTQRCSLMKNEL